jgi:hypothetical protein
MLRAAPFLISTLLVAATLSVPSEGLAAGRGPSTAPARGPTPLVETVLLMGQSNMVGRDRPVDDSPDARVRAFVGDGWRIAIEPLHGGGYGPGVAFGHRLVADSPVQGVRLIACAEGSSSMARWLPTGDLYQACLAELRRTRRTASGALFYQGESDAGALETATAWGQRFHAMVQGLRRDTGNPHLPVVFAQLGTTNRPAPFWSVVKASQATVSLPQVAMIRTEDLPVFDGLHLTVGAQRVVGCRFAREYARLRGLPAVGEEC